MAGIFGNPSASGAFGGGWLGQPDQMPQVPFRQNPVITALGSSLLGGKNMAGNYDFSSMGPAVVAKSAMQGQMQNKQMDAAQRAKVSEAWGAVMRAKSAGQPPPPEAMSVLVESNPAIAGKYFEGMMPGSGSEYGLNGIWARDPETDQWGVFQPNKAGGAPAQVQFPGGYQPKPPTSNVNLGTTIQPVTTRGGVIAGPGLKIDVAEEQAAREQGGARGKAAANLPLVEASSDRIIRMIDDVATDPYLPNMVGPVEGRSPNVSGNAARVQSKLDMVLGGTFLQAYNDLRGAGQITENETEAATAAYNRLATTTMDDADYMQALAEFRKEIVKLTEIARQRAGQPATATPSTPSGPDPVYVSPSGDKVFAE